MFKTDKDNLNKLSPTEKRKLLAKLLQKKFPSGKLFKDKTKLVKDVQISKISPSAKVENIPAVKLFRQQYELFSKNIIPNVFFRVNEGIANNKTFIQGKELINYAGYNYLGFSGDKRVSEMAKASIDEYGTSVSASRIASGEKPIHQELEKEIANFLGVEEALVFSSGHATNVNTISHLFGPKDLIIYDSLSHNSILQGCLLANSTRMPFLHNDLNSLAQVLEKHRYSYERALIVIEGVYSTEGDIPDLAAIMEIKKKYNVFLMIDEAHSIGTIGKIGRGVAEYSGINPKEVEIWMGTLSKSLASCGGYIAGSELLIQCLKYTAPGFLFSAGISPANSAAALAALRFLKQEPYRVSVLQENFHFFLNKAKEKGIDTGFSQDAPVVPVVVKNSEKCIQLSDFLFNRGINVQPMIYPAVPEEDARLRFFITFDHAKEEMEYTINKISEGIKVLRI